MHSVVRGWIALVMLVGCGGTAPDLLGAHAWRAKAFQDDPPGATACASFAREFDVTATGSFSGSTFTLSGNENGVAFTSTSDATVHIAMWFDPQQPPVVEHLYWTRGNAIELWIIVNGKCGVRYSLTG